MDNVLPQVPWGSVRHGETRDVRHSGETGAVLRLLTVPSIRSEQPTGMAPESPAGTTHHNSTLSRRLTRVRRSTSPRRAKKGGHAGGRGQNRTVRDTHPTWLPRFENLSAGTRKALNAALRLLSVASVCSVVQQGFFCDLVPLGDLCGLARGCSDPHGLKPILRPIAFLQRLKRQNTPRAKNSLFLPAQGVAPFWRVVRAQNSVTIHATRPQGRGKPSDL